MLGLDKVLSFGPRGSGALVFESDGFRLRGALVQGRGDDMTVAGPFVSRTADEASAIEEIMRRIRSHSPRLPKTAVLVSANVVSGLVDLPVDPSKPRPRAQMQEVVRWELEPIYANQHELWMIGAVLEGRGYLTREQRHEIAVDLETATSAGGGRRLMRFGELAVEKGFVTREQLDECLLLRERLAVVDDDIVCGWQHQVSENSEHTVHTPWYVCGISRSLRERWSAAFRRNGLKLEWIYPLVGSAYPALAAMEQHNAQRVLLQVHQDQISCLRGDAEAVFGLRVETLGARTKVVDACVDLCHEEMRPGIDRIYLLAEAGSTTAELSARLGRDILSLSAQKDTLVGAAKHVLGQASSRLAVRAAGDDPAPPIWRNRDAMRIGVAAAGILLVAGTEGSLRWDLNEKNERLAALNLEFSEGLKLTKQMRTANRELEAMSKTVEARQSELAEVTERLTLIEDVLMARQRSVPAILAALQEAVNDDVLIESIEESKGSTNYFAMSGWALSDTAGQLFVSKLDRELEPWGLTVADEKLRRGRGPLGLDGYSIDLRLIPRPPSELSERTDVPKVN